VSPVVVKVGGSLLDWPELPDRLARYLKARGGDLVLIVGGGRAADLVRTLDRLHDLGQERSHQLALHSLDLTAHLLAALVPGLVVIDQVKALRSRGDAEIVPVLAPRLFLQDDDRSADALPHTWDVTSDSIAARIAVRLEASELVLLKSSPIPLGTDRDEAARLGLVDRVFPAAARMLERVAYVCLRDPASPDGPVWL
jgi:5-(aminomethyl)-3-furanmethanol phosphate kinase